MPLIKISTTHIEQRCARCGKVHTLTIGTLKLGLSCGGADGIALPPCECGAAETLFRNHSAPPSNANSHRKAVNALALLLKQQGRTEEAHAAVYAADGAAKDCMEIVGEVAVVPTQEQL